MNRDFLLRFLFAPDAGGAGGSGGEPAGGEPGGQGSQGGESGSQGGAPAGGASGGEGGNSGGNGDQGGANAGGNPANNGGAPAAGGTPPSPQNAGSSDELATVKQQLAAAQAQAARAQLDNAATLQALELGAELKSIPYILKLADFSKVVKDGKTDAGKLKEAIEKVLNDIPSLKKSSTPSGGFIRVGADGKPEGNGGQSAPQVAKKRWNRFN